MPVLNCHSYETWHRVGVVPLGLDVPKSAVFMRLSGLGTF